MDVAEKKVARARLSVLELAEALGNVSEACRRRGMDRTQFYEYKRRFQTHGIEGLRDLPPVHKSHPQTTSPENVEAILNLSLQYPAWGCRRLSDQLALQGIRISAPTIQSILAKNDMATMADRLFKLEAKSASEPIQLTSEQVRAIERNNPAFRERHIESSRPGELLAQDTFYVGSLKGVGKVYMQVVIDTFGSYAFGFLHTTKQQECAVAVLHNDVLPFYEEKRIPIKAIITDNGTEFCGKETHAYEFYLALNDIEHRKTRYRRPQSNGFAERFNRTMLDEFFRKAFREKFYTSVEDLQADFDVWLNHYNHERPHRGYRNNGRRPIETIDQFLLPVGREG